MADAGGTIAGDASKRNAQESALLRRTMEMCKQSFRRCRAWRRATAARIGASASRCSVLTVLESFIHRCDQIHADTMQVAAGAPLPAAFHFTQLANDPH